MPGGAGSLQSTVGVLVVVFVFVLVEACGT